MVSTLVDHAPAPLKFTALRPWMIPGFARDPFARIARRDQMIFHPYQGYDAVEDFARAAARDPEVTAMRATLYRVGDDNVLAESLIEASRAGKDVAVLLEARARFDELQNLEWGLRFQNSGVRVLPLALAQGARQGHLGPARAARVRPPRDGQLQHPQRPALHRLLALHRRRRRSPAT